MDFQEFDHWIVSQCIYEIIDTIEQRCTYNEDEVKKQINNILVRRKEMYFRGEYELEDGEIIQ
jgi:hypothetical protein